VRWAFVFLLLNGCTTVYLRERTSEAPGGGVVAVRGAGWDHASGPNQTKIEEVKTTIMTVCKEGYKVTAKGVEATHAPSYWSVPFFGIWSAAIYGEEYRFRFSCHAAAKPDGQTTTSGPDTTAK
jgi:hypothetical protein